MIAPANSRQGPQTVRGEIEQISDTGVRIAGHWYSVSAVCGCRLAESANVSRSGRSRCRPLARMSAW
jgi:hypothetical protein